MGRVSDRISCKLLMVRPTPFPTTCSMHPSQSCLCLEDTRTAEWRSPARHQRQLSRSRWLPSAGRARNRNPPSRASSRSRSQRLCRGWMRCLSRRSRASPRVRSSQTRRMCVVFAGTESSCLRASQSHGLGPRSDIQNPSPQSAEARFIRVCFGLNSGAPQPDSPTIRTISCRG